MSAPIPKEKVLAYITRHRNGELELLVLEHRDIPEAGIQIPGGTVDAGESIAEALVREVYEESGLTLENAGTLLGRFQWFRKDRNELHHRNVFHISAPREVAEEWLHIVKSNGEDSEMPFRFYWLPVAKAKGKLAADLDAYLGEIN